MNPFDAIILLILGLLAVRGLIKGIVLEVLTLLGLILAYFIAIREMSTLATIIGKGIELPPAALTTISFIIIFVIIFIIVRLIAGAISKLIKKSPVGWLDRGGGFCLGLTKGAIIASLAAMLVSLFPLSGIWKAKQDQSLLFKPIQVVAPALFNTAQKIFPEAKNFTEEMREVIDSQTDKAKEYILKKQIDSIQDTLDKEAKVLQDAAKNLNK
ncbi:CvpA family protein [candidate division KSB1 bacterium]|nr:CvpA family protein [candidate division KSB1 bacterium]